MMATFIQEDTLQIREIFVEGHDKVYKVEDVRVGLNGIICLHNLTLGPALGGIRIYPYENMEDALYDVKRLAEGMTYKSAISGCSWGGGKSVIMASPAEKTEDLLLSFGRAIDLLEGVYIGAEDVGSSPKDINIMSRSTKYLVGLDHEKSSGNPSAFTAWGVYRGIQASLQKAYGSDSVQGKVIAIQGVGSVGSFLADMLFWNGAKLILSDINEEKAKTLARQYGAKYCNSKEILTVDCDVLAPCALGGILTPSIIAQLRCKIVAGAANNQLFTDAAGTMLMERGILYAPDFVINAGGLINVTEELLPEGYNSMSSREKINKLYEQLLAIYEIAELERISTNQAAKSLGDYRIANKIGVRVAAPCFHHAACS
jgi:leucine dehydrogenase